MKRFLCCFIGSVCFSFSLWACSGKDATETPTESTHQEATATQEVPQENHAKELVQDAGHPEPSSFPEKVQESSSTVPEPIVESGTEKNTGFEQAANKSKVFEVTTKNGGCLDIPTGQLTPSGKSCKGQLELLPGANVDLSSPGLNGMPICYKGKGVTDASEIPGVLQGCKWEDYYEGFEGLDGHGFIIRNAAKTSYFKFHIITNQCKGCPKGQYKLKYSFQAFTP